MTYGIRYVMKYSNNIGGYHSHNGTTKSNLCNNSNRSCSGRATTTSRSTSTNQYVDTHDKALVV